MNWITNSWTNESWSRISIVRRSSKIISISTIKPLQSNEGEANPFIASIVRTYVKEYKLGYIKYSKKNYIVQLIALDYFSLNTIDSKHVIKCVQTRLQWHVVMTLLGLKGKWKRLWRLSRVISAQENEGWPKRMCTSKDVESSLNI